MKCIRIEPTSPEERVQRAMFYQMKLHQACYVTLGKPATVEERTLVGTDMITALLMQAATMASAFCDADTGDDTNTIALGNDLIDFVNKWLDTQRSKLVN